MKKNEFLLPRWRWTEAESFKEASFPLHLILICGAHAASHVPQQSLLDNVISARALEKQAALKEGVWATDQRGNTYFWVSLEGSVSRFQLQESLAKVIKATQGDAVTRVALQLIGEQAAQIAPTALYCFLTNHVSLTPHKRPDKPFLQEVVLSAPKAAYDGCVTAEVLAKANTLTRFLTVQAPNTLTPQYYRQKLKGFAEQHQLHYEQWDERRLRQIGAGAFLAVSQGSQNQQAAIVKLSYRPRGAKWRLALVGKGICFDTGGHNLKPARYMYNMHEDMNGSAVVLGLLQAIVALKLPIQVDGWLAVAENHLSPVAYKPNDVVKALNGQTIEIVHTDAEGRMVLADTLTLADRTQPHLLIDFATLTGSMHVALGSRMSGVFVNRPEWVGPALQAGQASGERVVYFPAPEDYDAALASQVADVKQCTLEGEADHILAVRFLSKFVQHSPWIHMDLSASRNQGGLGAITTDVTGFGVLWGMQLIDSWLKNKL